MPRPLLLLLLLLGPSSAQIPLACANPESVGAGRCCPPFWGDGTPCGRRTGRGECHRVPGGAAVRRVRGAGDFRLGWPSTLFREVCRCQGNYWGPDCGDCRPGWRGSGCRERAVVRRREFGGMSREEQRDVLCLLRRAKSCPSRRYAIYASDRGDPPGAPLAFRPASPYDLFVWSHYLTAKRLPNGGSASRFGHGSLGFLPWHRLHLLALELEVRNLTGRQDFALPVWDWAGKRGCEICLPGLFGGHGADGRLEGPFRDWKAFCSTPEENPLSMELVCPPGHQLPIRRFDQPDVRFGQLPRREDVEACLRLESIDTPPYSIDSRDSFRNTLEGYVNGPNSSTEGMGMHNMVHLYFGGFMSNILLAANDPIFVPVHCHVDRIFETWLRQNQTRRHSYPATGLEEGHRATDNIMPFLPLFQNAEMLQSTESFGYTYD